MDVLARFSRVWCPTCNKTQPMIFDVMKANDKNDHDAADIVCDECKSIIATLHGPSAHRAGVRTDRAEKAQAMAGQEIDRLSDPSATDEERQRLRSSVNCSVLSSIFISATRPNRRAAPGQVRRGTATGPWQRRVEGGSQFPVCRCQLLTLRYRDSRGRITFTTTTMNVVTRFYDSGGHLTGTVIGSCRR